MNGLFREHGPCLINKEGTAVDSNLQSWNENSNM